MNTKTIKHSLKDPRRDPKVRTILQLATFDQWLKAEGSKIEERDGSLVLVKKDGRTHVIFPKGSKIEERDGTLVLVEKDGRTHAMFPIPKESKKETSLTPLDILHRFYGRPEHD